MPNGTNVPNMTLFAEIQNSILTASRNIIGKRTVIYLRATTALRMTRLKKNKEPQQKMKPAQLQGTILGGRKTLTENEHGNTHLKSRTTSPFR